MGCYIEFLILKEKILEVAGEEISMPVTVDEQRTPQLSDFMIGFGTAGRCLPMTHSSGSLPAVRCFLSAYCIALGTFVLTSTSLNTEKGVHVTNICA